MKKFSLLGALIISAGLSSCSMHSHHDRPEQREPRVQNSMPPQISHEEMMKQWKAYATPAEGHKKLRALEGDWSYTSRFWMTSDGKPETAGGTAEHRFVLGGRFLEERVKGTAMGQPFEGRGFIGYDNIAKEYTSLFMDNMGTGMMTSKGRFNDADKTLEENGSVSCPMVNGPISIRGLWTIVSKNQIKYETFMLDPQGKEFLSMELIYKRR